MLETAEEYISGHVSTGNREPRLAFLSDEELIENVYNAIESEKFYLFIAPADGGFGDIAQRIENTYYKPMTDANKDFALVMNADGLWIVLAAKKFMTKEQLYQIIGSKTESKEDFIKSNADLFPMTFAHSNNRLVMEMVENLIRRKLG